MKYIGPFFRINSLTSLEIESQLFFLSREALKHIVLQSRCGLIASSKTSKKYLSNNDINIIKDFSPLLCIYKKGSPKFASTKHFHGWSDDGVKKEISSSSNALMTLSILELSEFYAKFEKSSSINYSMAKIYRALAKQQLDFYSKQLRNTDGVFVDKKNLSEGNSEFNLMDKDKKFKFSDQALMMVAYYLYWNICTFDEDREMYKDFSLDILNMFLNYKEEIYDLSFQECCKICFAFNTLYKYSNNDDVKLFLIDITDYLVDKYNEKNYILDNLDYSCLMAINLHLSYKNTGIESFKDNFLQISERHKRLFDDTSGIFLKPMEKKDIKYDCTEVNNYMLNMLIYEEYDSSRDFKAMISTLFRQFYITSGLVISWPDAPSLDSDERYKNLTLNSADLIDESMFRVSTTPSPDTTGTAPIFLKKISYSKKKENFVTSKITFDSAKNLTNFFNIIFLFKDTIMKSFFLTEETLPKEKVEMDISENEVLDITEKITDETHNKI
ncbi:hypothetical protein JHL18_07370 [Clostridium sp. YIM B02505]|uniref:Uncharacterized protein n=1 Tax=Clostridium yunnanense TaxID=2800325 RepID=A0ABS1EM46_9CLOT|nr:hypothetical protein [Clostridium yunnanense]MBK1810451.1 hypothetical protein [Clostridium yunnanense]